MIRPIQESDRASYLAMAAEFFSSPVVLSPIPEEHITRTFDLLMQGTPFAEGYLFEQEGKTIGYALLARTWSQEAGGEVIWIEELYLRPEARGKGTGRAFLAFLETQYPSAKRFRLEVEKENTRAVALYESMGFSFFPYDQMKKDF